MQNGDLARREFVTRSVAVASSALLSAATLPLAAAESDTGVTRKVKIVCVGGHPDDPESGCAGTLVRYSAAGHSVTVIYLTRGERGIHDTALEEAARIRSAECEAACKIMGANPAFLARSTAPPS